MQVGRIYSRHLVTTTRSSSLLEAAKLMRRHHVGSLVVTDDQSESAHAIGIVTDRDLVLQAMANGVGPRDAAVADVMSEGLATVSDSADAYEALEVMRAKGVRRLAVSDAAGLLLGIVSLDDVIAGLGAEMGSLAAVLAKEMKSECELGHRGPLMIAVG